MRILKTTYRSPERRVPQVSECTGQQMRWPASREAARASALSTR